MADAESKLRRFQGAIEAGIDPAVLIDAVNQAQNERAAARAELDNIPAPNTLGAAEVHAMVDALGDLGSSLRSARPERLIDLYEAVRLQVMFEPEGRTVEVAIQPRPRVNSKCVRGGLAH